MNRTPNLDDLDATPYEKRLSRIAAEAWGVDPVRYGDDGDTYPLMRLDNPESNRTENIYRGRLGRFGILGSSDYPDAPIDRGWWTPIHTADGRAVMRGGKYRYIEGVGLIYTDFDSMFDKLPTALLKTLEYEANGTPMEQPYRLGAGPAIYLEAWRETSPFSEFKLDFIDNDGGRV